MVSGKATWLLTGIVGHADNARMNVRTIIRAGGGVVATATKLGVSHSTICDWQRSNCVPASRIRQISAVFGFPLEQVAKLTNPPRQPRRADALTEVV